MKARYEFAVLLAATVGIAGGVAQERKSSGEPISKLPPQVKFKEGALSLFADFENRDGKNVEIFVVNDTDQEIRLGAQDGDLYIKQEAKIDGTWVRSQPHRYSDCGNSYFPVPALASKSYFTRFSSKMNPYEWGPGAPEAKTKVLPVQYRFYTKKNFEIVSNMGEIPVSPEWIDMARYDTMALNFGPVEMVAAVATGAVEVKALDHMEPKSHAIGQLERFPGDPKAQDALRRVLTEQLKIDPGEDYRPRYQITSTFGSAFKVLDSDEVDDLCLEVIRNEASPYREEALRSYARGAKERAAGEVDALLDSILKDYSDSLFLPALMIRCLTWEKGEKRRGNIKAIIEDSAAPVAIRKEAKGLFERVCLNRVIWLRKEIEYDTGNFRVTIKNISDLRIELQYTHPLDLITTEMVIRAEEFTFAGKDVRNSENETKIEIPHRDDLSAVIDAERHDPVTKSLQPGETIVFESFNIWRYHQLPRTIPKTIEIQISTNLPQFDEVPSVARSVLSSVDQRCRKFLKQAMREQSGIER